MKTYISLVARANYLTLDRIDIAHATKGCARSMQSPTVEDWRRVERLVLYLKERPSLVQWFVFQNGPCRIEAFTDTDWAGCVVTRRSTTGGLAKFGQHTFRHWCRTQAVVARSSAEAEAYGAVRATSEVLELVSMYRDLGVENSGCVFGEASAALGIMHRQGFGKLRHLKTVLWVQEKAAKKDVEYKKVEGSKNIAGALTKALDSDTLTRHTEAPGNELTTLGDGKMVTYVGAAPCSSDALRKAEEFGQKHGMLQGWVRTDM